MRGFKVEEEIKKLEEKLRFLKNQRLQIEHELKDISWGCVWQTIK